MSNGGGFGGAAILDYEWPQIPESQPANLNPSGTVRTLLTYPKPNAESRAHDVEAVYAGCVGAALGYGASLAAESGITWPSQSLVAGTLAARLDALDIGAMHDFTRRRFRSFHRVFDLKRRPAEVSPGLIQVVAQQLQQALGASGVRSDIEADEHTTEPEAIHPSPRERVFVYAMVPLDDDAAIDKLIAFTSTPWWAKIVRATQNGIVVDIERV